MKLIVAICVLLTLGVSPSLHKFENGFVERTMSVIVRSDTAYVEYSVGLNESTLIDVLSEWKAEPDSSPSGSESTAVSPSPLTQSESNSNSTESNRLAVPTQQTQSDSGLESQEPAADILSDSDESAGHEIDAELLEKFQKLAISEIPGRLKITLDGQPVVVTSVTEGVAPRHPYTISIRFQFKIPETKSSGLLIEDSNFSAQSGAVRYSLKASGDAMLLRSNVAPVLGRSERVELENLTKSVRSAATSIDVRLAVVPASKD